MITNFDNLNNDFLSSLVLHISDATVPRVGEKDMHHS